MARSTPTAKEDGMAIQADYGIYDADSTVRVSRSPTSTPRRSSAGTHPTR